MTCVDIELFVLCEYVSCIDVSSCCIDCMSSFDVDVLINLLF